MTEYWLQKNLGLGFPRFSKSVGFGFQYGYRHSTDFNPVYGPQVCSLHLPVAKLSTRSWI